MPNLNYPYMRAILKIPLTRTDKIIEVLCLVLVLFIWVAVLVFYPRLPATIPVHFNLDGQPDLAGSKDQIFILPAIATFLYSGITILNKYPHIFNYLQQVTPGNARQLYTGATRLLRFLKLGVIVSFNVAVCETIQVALRQSDNLGKWLLPVSGILVMLPLGWYLVSQFITGKNSNIPKDKSSRPS